MGFASTHRQLLLGGGTAFGVVIFLAILVSLQYIVVQHPKRWDITKAGQYTLAPQSKQIIGSLKEKGISLDIIAFYENTEFSGKDKARALFDQYREVYSGVNYTFLDPDQKRAEAKKYDVQAYPTVILKTPSKEERITTCDEETFTNALVKLLRTESKKVYFLKGHGETSPQSAEQDGFSIAKKHVEKQNYQTDEIVLLQNPAVPKDAAMLIIAGPTVDPADPELSSIRDYVKAGGKILVMLNPFKTPKLAAMLKEYGFETSEDIIVDKMSRVLGGDYLMPVVTTYVDFPITKNFNVASFFPEARSVRVLSQPAPNSEPKELALTGPVSWTINEAQLKSGNATFDEKTGIKGPVSVMAVSTVTSSPETKEGAPAKPEGEKEFTDESPAAKAEGKTPDANKGSDTAPQRPAKARIVVIGSSQFASNKYFSLQGNGDLFMNTVSWLAEDENLISIRPKSPKARPVMLTPGQSWLIFLVAVVMAPLSWPIVGSIVYFYRRWTPVVA
ncbi:MAG: Gldg family protein [Pseudomonadota bacterium]